MQSRQVVLSVSDLSGGGLQDVHICTGPTKGGLVPTSRLHDFPQRNHVSFKDDHSSVPLSFRRNMTLRISVLGDGLLLDVQLHPETGDLSLCPCPDCSVGHATNDGRCLTDVEVPMSVFIDVRGDSSHPEKQPRSADENNGGFTFAGLDYVPHTNSQADGFFD